MALQTIEVTFNDDGTANIRLPEGKRITGVNPAKVAELTEKLAKSLGKIVERHAAHSHIHLDQKSGKMVSDEQSTGQ
jgi:hypothetical protein